jgi:hypothetical protein
LVFEVPHPLAAEMTKLSATLGLGIEVSVAAYARSVDDLLR